MKALVLVALLALACADAPPPTDKIVASKYVGTKEESRSGVVGPYVVVIPVTVAAYYLVSRDHMVCEVDASEYASADVGRLASCVWGER